MRWRRCARRLAGQAAEISAGRGGALGGLFGGGGFGGQGGGGGGFGGGGRGNFRGFNPGQPHGAIFWIGSNSALNAEPFSLRGQPQEQPASGTNRFGITFMSAPYIPHLTKPSGKDTVFLTLSGTRSSTPQDQYATVPTDGSNGTYDQRAGNFTGQPAIYDPVNDTNVREVRRNAGPALSRQHDSHGVHCASGDARCCWEPRRLPQYFPAPNLTGAAASNGYNYHLLTTAQSNSTQAGARYMRSLGKNATQPGAGGRGGFGGGRQEPEPGPAAEHQLQLQLERLGLGQREYVSAAGRQELIEREQRAGRLHGGLSQDHQRLQRQLEPQHQPEDELLYRRN